MERSDPLLTDSVRVSSEIPEWLQEFREISVDDEIPAHGDSHASSSHEASLEPTIERREDLGKHSVYTHFPKDRIHVSTNSIAMWETLPNNADWDCFKTPILQEILRTQNLLRVEHCAFFREVIHLFR